MSKLSCTPYTLPSIYATIIRSFRWKSFEHGDMSKFPTEAVFFRIMKKHHCKQPQTVAKHLMGVFYEGAKDDRKNFGKVMSAVQFLKPLQFLIYNYKAWDNEDVNDVIRKLAEWLVSRTPEYENAEWNF